MRAKQNPDKKPKAKHQATVTMPANLEKAYYSVQDIGGFAPAVLCAAGFLAVLESQKIRMAALKRFAEFKKSGPLVSDVEAWLTTLFTGGTSDGAADADAAADDAASEENPRSKGHSGTK